MTVKPIPDGYTSVTPYLIVRDADRLIQFLTDAFGARVHEAHKTPDGAIVHADVVIGDAHIMLAQASGQWPERKGSILLYVPDADATYARALAAGATSVYEVVTQFYGDRSGGVEDPCGVTWWISTHVEDVAPEEIERRMKAHR